MEVERPGRLEGMDVEASHMDNAADDLAPVDAPTDAPTFDAYLPGGDVAPHPETSGDDIV